MSARRGNEREIRVVRLLGAAQPRPPANSPAKTPMKEQLVTPAEVVRNAAASRRVVKPHTVSVETSPSLSNARSLSSSGKSQTATFETHAQPTGGTFDSRVHTVTVSAGKSEFVELPEDYPESNHTANDGIGSNLASHGPKERGDDESLRIKMRQSESENNVSEKEILLDHPVASAHGDSHGTTKSGMPRPSRRSSIVSSSSTTAELETAAAIKYVEFQNKQLLEKNAHLQETINAMHAAQRELLVHVAQISRQAQEADAAYLEERRKAERLQHRVYDLERAVEDFNRQKIADLDLQKISEKNMVENSPSYRTIAEGATLEIERLRTELVDSKTLLTKLEADHRQVLDLIGVMGHALAAQSTKPTPSPVQAGSTSEPPILAVPVAVTTAAISKPDTVPATPASATVSVSPSSQKEGNEESLPQSGGLSTSGAARKLFSGASLPQQSVQALHSENAIGVISTPTKPRTSDLRPPFVVAGWPSGGTEFNARIAGFPTSTSVAATVSKSPARTPSNSVSSTSTSGTKPRPQLYLNSGVRGENHRDRIEEYFKSINVKDSTNSLPASRTVPLNATPSAAANFALNSPQVYEAQQRERILELQQALSTGTRTQSDRKREKQSKVTQPPQ